MTGERQTSFLRRCVRQALALWPAAALARGIVRPMASVPWLRRGLIGLLFGAGGAGALSLGEIGLQSHLGEPLRASIPVTLQNGEMLDARCVTTRVPSGSAASVPDLRLAVPATVRPGQHEIRLSSAVPLSEPLYELELQVNCVGTARSIRDYVLMLDPPGRAPVVAQTAAPAPARVTPAAPRPVARVAPRPVSSQPSVTPPPRQRAPRAAMTPGAGFAYRVASGDTLYGIARRTSGYSGATLWALVDRIHALNPAAFVDGDPTRIRLGAEILIPLAAPASVGVTAPRAAPSATPPPVPPGRDEMPPTPAADPTPPAPNAAASAARTVAAPLPQAPGTGSFAPAAIPVAKPPVRPERPSAARPFGAPAAAEPAGPSVEILAGVAVALLLSLLLWSRPIVELVSRWRHGRRTAPRPQPHPLRRANDQHAGDIAVTIPAIRPRDSIGIEVTRVAELDTSAAEWFAAAEPQDADEGDISAELSGLFEAGESAADEPEPASADLDFAATMVERPMLDADTGTVPSADALTDMETLLTAPVDRADTEWGTGETRNPKGLGSREQAADEDSDYSRIDLQTLAVQAEGDDRLSRTLMDALMLLERDYQEELTGSRLEKLNVAQADEADHDDAPDEPGKLQQRARRSVG